MGTTPISPSIILLNKTEDLFISTFLRIIDKGNKFPFIIFKYRFADLLPLNLKLRLGDTAILSPDNEKSISRYFKFVDSILSPNK